MRFIAYRRSVVFIATLAPLVGSLFGACSTAAPLTPGSDGGLPATQVDGGSVVAIVDGAAAAEDGTVERPRFPPF